MFTDPSMNAAKGQSTGADQAQVHVPDAAPHSQLETVVVARVPQGRSPIAPSLPHAAKGLKESALAAMPGLPDAAPNDGKGQRRRADTARLPLPDLSPVEAEGQDDPAERLGSGVPDASPVAEIGRHAVAGQAKGGVPISASIDQLAELQVRRKFWIGNVNKQTNAVKALVRRGLGWRYDEDEADREKVNGRAARIVAAALAGKDQKPEDQAVFSALASDLAAVATAIEPCAAARHEIELEMKRIVRKLPIFAWAKEVKGFGELGLAVVLAEAGDLSGYPKKGHLWKRLGLAPFEGKAYSTWRMKGGLTAEDWTEAGYSPRRRAEVYAVISEPLFRAQSVAQGPYRAIYDRRREATAVAHPDWTKAHSHMDALRVITKILLRDLWQEWRRAYVVVPSQASADEPAADTVQIGGAS